MTIRINNLSLSLDDDISLLKKKVSKKLRISEKEIESMENAGIKVVSGASGRAFDVVASYLNDHPAEVAACV